MDASLDLDLSSSGPGNREVAGVVRPMVWCSVLCGFGLLLPTGLRAAEEGAVTLTARARTTWRTFALDPSAERVHGVAFEVRGEPGAIVEVRSYKTLCGDGSLRHGELIGHLVSDSPVITDTWETKRIELLVKKRSATLSLEFALVGDRPAEMRNVRLFPGGFRENPPLPEAPYVDWIESLRANHEFASRCPLVEFSDGGDDTFGSCGNRHVYISDARQKKLETAIAPYMRISALQLAALMPSHRPFKFHGGRWGTALAWVNGPPRKPVKRVFSWRPDRPGLLFNQDGTVFDLAKAFPVHGHEEVVTPSGRLQRYAYHDTDKSDEIYEGRRIYHDEFVTTAAVNSLVGAGYTMAGLYRKTGDREYGLRSAAVFWAFARAMADWPVFGQPGYNSHRREQRFYPPDHYGVWSYIFGGGWGETWYVMASCHLLLPAYYYDLIRDAPVWTELSDLTETDARTEAATGLLRAAQMILKRDADSRYSPYLFFHNLSGGPHRSLVQIGRAVGCPELVHYAVRKIVGTFRMRFMVDGVFPESFHYSTDQIGRQQQALQQLEGYSDPPGFRCQVDGSHLDAFDLATSVPEITRIMRVYHRQTYPDGSPHTVHDSWSLTSYPRDESWQKQFPPRARVEPFLMPAYGHAILGRGRAPKRIESHLHFSGFYNHGHFDMLNLILWAYGDELASDVGYTHIGQYGVTSLSHNLVIVDRSVQKRTGAGGLLSWHARDGGCQVVQADQGARPAYPQCRIYRRALVLIPLPTGRNAVLDIFEVSGGDRHEWMANGCADYAQTVSSNLPQGMELDNLAADGVALTDPCPKGWSAQQRDQYGSPSAYYGSFRNATVSDLTTPWQVTMRPGPPASPDSLSAGDRAKSNAAKPGLRLHWFAPCDGEAILCEAPRNRYLKEIYNKGDASQAWAGDRMPKVIVRRTGQALSSTFAALWEPFHDRPFLEEVVPLADLAGEGLGVEIKAETARCTVLYLPPESHERLSASGLAGDGRFTVRSETKGETSLDLFDGTAIECSSLSARVKTYPPLPVTGLKREKIGHVIALAGALDGYPESVACQPHAGEYICFRHENNAPRWLKLARIEKDGENTRLVLDGDPGFTFDADRRILQETCFPLGVHIGAARVVLPSWINLRWAKPKPSVMLLRASGAVRLKLHGRRDVTRVVSRPALSADPGSEVTFRRQGEDLLLHLKPLVRAGAWQEIQLLAAEAPGP